MSNYSLKLVKPVTVTPTMLVSTTVTDPTPTYSGSATYAIGARAKNADGTLIYESLANSNTGNPLTDATKWILVSASNPWRVFDTSNSTQSKQTTSMQWVLEPGQAITAVSVLNIVGGTSLNIALDDPTYGIVYDRTIDLSAIPLIADWWSWFFGERRGPSLSVAADLPSYPEAELTITITGTADLAVGVILFGQMRELGLGVRHGARIGIQDYSRKETNEFGDTVLVQRAFAKRASFDLIISKSDVDLIQSELASIRAVPSLWIGSSGYESTVIFGIYKDFEVLISYDAYADCSIELEGLT